MPQKDIGYKGRGCTFSIALTEPYRPGLPVYIVPTQPQQPRLSCPVYRGYVAQSKQSIPLLILPSFDLAVKSPPSLQIAGYLVVGGSALAVVADELEAADHLADGEEADALSQQDAAADELGGRDVAGALDEGAGLGGGALGGLQQGAGVLDALDGSLEVGLEGGDGAAYRPSLVNHILE